MRFKTGLVMGAALGYVLGARAGRERYEQIKRAAAEARRHPAVSQLVDQGVGLVDAGRYVAATGLSAGAKGLRSIDHQTGSE
ncbi:MAG TPA: YtxH domain-containing protein [Acidimicrobiia bacterium]|nr:YtxH domain-containing protein [Acidimicrobiia bacterium]